MTKASGNWLKSFCALHEATEMPRNYIKWAGVSAIAGALKRNVFYNGGRFRLYPNQYICLIGPPAIKKSTSVDLCFNLLRKVEDINIGPSGVTWQYLVDKLVALNYGKLEDIKNGGAILSDNAPISIPVPELGTFLDFENRDFLDFMCVLWDSPPIHEKGTRIMGDQIIHGPCLNLLGGVTPTWVKLYMKPQFFDTGFLSRMLFVYADAGHAEIAWPDLLVKEDHTQEEELLAYGLKKLGQLNGAITLSPEARALGVKFYSQNNQKVKLLNDYTVSWAARKFYHIIKLSICLAAAESSSLLITGPIWLEAEDMIESLHKDLYKVIAYMQERKELAGQRDLIDFINKNSPVAEAKLYNTFYTKMLQREIKDSLTNILSSGKYSKFLDPVDNVVKIIKL